MHTGECNDAREYWPEGKGTDVDVSSLVAAGGVTNPRRIPGMGRWLGFWGPSFAGLRVGYSPTDSYPVINGLAVPYPLDLDDAGGVDLYLSRDTGGSGTVSIARFKTEAAAKAWGGQPTPGTGSSGGAASLPNRSNPRTVGSIDSNAETTITWAISGFMFATIRNDGPGTVMIGSVTGTLLFALPVNGVLNGYVGNATGFLATGLSAVIADTLSIIEYGRT